MALAYALKRKSETGKCDLLIKRGKKDGQPGGRQQCLPAVVMLQGRQKSTSNKQKYIVFANSPIHTESKRKRRLSPFCEPFWNAQENTTMHSIYTSSPASMLLARPSHRLIATSTPSSFLDISGHQPSVHPTFGTSGFPCRRHKPPVPNPPLDRCGWSENLPFKKASR